MEEEIRGVPSRGDGDEVRTARCLYPSTAERNTGQKRKQVSSICLREFFIPLADRKIVAEYERTVAQMIGELAPPAGSMLYVF